MESAWPPHRHVGGSKLELKLSNIFEAEVEDGSGQSCVGVAGAEYIDKMLRRSRAARGNHGNRNGVGHSLRQFTIETRFRAVAIHRGEENFSRTASRCLARPLDRIPACGSAAARNEYLAAILYRTVVYPPRIDRYYDRLRAKAGGDFFNQRRILHRGRIDGDLIRARLEHIGGVGEFANPSADGDWYKQGARRARDDVEHRLPLVARGRDIEQDNFIRAIAGVSGGTFRRIAGIAQVNELHAFHDPASVHIETGDDALGQHLSSPISQPHESSSQKFLSMSRPTFHDFSGWNCTPKIFSFSTTAENGTPYSVAAAVPETIGA